MSYLYSSAYLLNVHKNFWLPRNINQYVTALRKISFWSIGKQGKKDTKCTTNAIEVAQRKRIIVTTGALYFRYQSTRIFLLVSNMDSLSDRTENESLAKRLKLDLSGSNEGVLCNGGSFSNISTTADGAIGHTEGKFYKICLIV